MCHFGDFDRQHSNGDLHIFHVFHHLVAVPKCLDRVYYPTWCLWCLLRNTHDVDMVRSACLSVLLTTSNLMSKSDKWQKSVTASGSNAYSIDPLLIGHFTGSFMFQSWNIRLVLPCSYYNLQLEPGWEIMMIIRLSPRNTGHSMRSDDLIISH